MLKGIPAILSPDLLKVMMEMGHGDELVLADGNFPAASLARRLVRLDGHGIPEMLEAILGLFPLDGYVREPVALMKVVEGDPTKPEIWERYRAILASSTGSEVRIELVERSAFYERARGAYAIAASGESALYANIILRKGVVLPSSGGKGSVHGAS